MAEVVVVWFTDVLIQVEVVGTVLNTGVAIAVRFKDVKNQFEVVGNVQNMEWEVAIATLTVVKSAHLQVGNAKNMAEVVFARLTDVLHQFVAVENV